MSLYRQIMQDSPLVYWPFDEAVDGSTAKDASGNGRNATKVATGASLGAASVVPGHPYSSLQNASGYWNRADEAAFQVGTGDFSFECWLVCSMGTGTYVEVLGRDVSSSGDGQMFLLNLTTGAARLWTGGTLIVGTTRISDGLRHHCVYRRISGTVNFFLDTVLDASGSAPNSIASPHALRAFVCGGSSSYFQGRMAHFAYYNVGLSNDRIKAHYEAGIRSGVVV